MKSFGKTHFVFIASLIALMSFEPVLSKSEKAALFMRGVPPKNAIWLESLDMEKLSKGGFASVGASSLGGPLLFEGNIVPHGICSYGTSYYIINLNGAVTRFASLVGIQGDRKKGVGSVIFQVWLDGEKVSETPVMHGKDKPVVISADTNGAKQMMLVADSAGDGTNNDIAVWGGAMLFLDPDAKTKPEAVDIEAEPYPIAHTDPNAYGIHGPRVIGATPGKPFLFLIPATGAGPLKFAARNLPAGLILDAKTGIISGSLKKDGEYRVKLTVKGPKGAAKRELKIIGGRNKLALTPPMGWNSWNVWAKAVDDEKIRQAAEWMVRSGLASHGYQYINIDDTWEGSRDATGRITSNNKFPDMKALGDFVHSKGLKFGIYTSPGPTTCARFPGSYLHEEQDAGTWASWGVDYLKHDWCSYNEVTGVKGDIADNSREQRQKPYIVMKAALDKSGRDIVFAGNMAPEWGAEVGGNLWRTSDDISDSFARVTYNGFQENGLEKYAGPGHWNDPDMLVVGYVGWGPNLHPTHLSRNSQITHITLWSMLAAPLLLGCDMSRIDNFTLDLLTNDEVLDIDQDPLGIQASRVFADGNLEVWSRKLWDGTIAVAFFNRYIEKASVTVKWQDVGLKGPQPVRNLWQKKNMGLFDEQYTASVPPLGAVMVKIGKPKSLK